MRVLVTGATSGIGRAIAQEFAARGHDLVLVARDRSRLEELASELSNTHGGRCEVLVADLSTPGGVVLANRRLTDAEHPVDVLVNNAGIGLPPGGFLGNDIEASAALNALNIDAVMRLTHAIVPLLIERGRGGIITIASVAGFMPGTAATTYSASKAWATTFSEGLHHLLRGTGVTSVAVTPGFVRSEFHARSGVDMRAMPKWLWLSADDVARAAVRGFELRRPLVIPGLGWKLAITVGTRLPRPWIRAAFAYFMGAINRRGPQ